MINGSDRRAETRRSRRRALAILKKGHRQKAFSDASVFLNCRERVQVGSVQSFRLPAWHTLFPVDEPGDTSSSHDLHPLLERFLALASPFEDRLRGHPGEYLIDRQEAFTYVRINTTPQHNSDIASGTCHFVGADWRPLVMAAFVGE